MLFLFLVLFVLRHSAQLIEFDHIQAQKFRPGIIHVFFHPDHCPFLLKPDVSDPVQDSEGS